MKKIYSLVCIFLLTGSTAFSQTYLLKSEISPIESSRDSRFAVQAAVMDNDTWCRVSWSNFYYPTELGWDDDDAEDYFLWSNPGNMSANKFHPYGYPVIVSGGRIYVGDGSFPGPFMGSSFRVLVYDDNGTNGLPGTALDSMDVTVTNYEWVAFEGMTASITEGDFYLAMKQTAPSPNTAPVGVDLEFPIYFKSYIYSQENPGWVTAPIQDFMIRAWTYNYNEPERLIDSFQVARFSNFNPFEPPLLADTTVLDTVADSEYNDYDWDGLPAGLYAYGVRIHFTGGEWSDYEVSNAVEHLMYPYTPSCFYQADSANKPLTICPPQDLNGAIPNYFLGYNLYLDENLVSFLPPTATSYDPGVEQPGIYIFELTAVYDLSPIGFPGETTESIALISEYRKREGFPLPFLEPWNYGDFETNNWQTDGDNWSIIGQTGNPIPAAQFTWDPIITNYESSLTSYPLLADSLVQGQIYVDFDIKLNSVVPTGNEFMLVQVWNWESKVWTTADSLSNIDGSFDWMAEHVDITSLAMGQVFKIRFSARGENSIDILSWFIDNIHVYRVCTPPENLEAQLNYGLGGIELNWEKPQGVSPEEQWIHWDDGEFSGNSISAGLYVSFAARWIHEQLTDFEGAYLTKIAFVPGEGISTYNVRVWEGDSAETLLIDQPVPNPIMGQWNTITLNSPLLLDITRDLWVGYYLELEYGYPGGVDDGPAIDGYGNMLCFGGTWWTLLEINPSLDYNWNIKAFIEPGAVPDGACEYAIYRSDNDDPYFLRAYSDTNYYLDDSLSKGLWCYYVTALYSRETDTCESSPTNEACEFVGINEKDHEAGLRIYPIPSSDFIKIESSEKIDLLYLYNPFGELILRKKVDEKQVEIPVASYPSGVYLMRVETGSRVISKKVIVVH